MPNEAAIEHDRHLTARPGFIELAFLVLVWQPSGMADS
jgi:hypothetical protein